MNIIPPRLPDDLAPVDCLAEYAQPFLRDDRTISQIKCSGEKTENADFYRLDVRTSAFENGAFHNCCFEKSAFIDVLFRSCDFSNCNFQGAYFERCRFLSCKCVGTDMVGAVWKQTTVEDSNLRYMNLNTAKLNGVRFSRVDFAEASMAEVKLTKFYAEESKFIGNNFNKTLLAGVDFSKNELVSPIVSSPPVELKGIVIDMFQAADLVSLLGIRVKRP